MGNQSGADRSLVAPLEQTPRSRRGNSRAHGGFSETPVCPLVDALVIHILLTNRRSALLWEDQLMNNDNVAAVRNAYAVAERKDLEGWINLFTPDGVFVDHSVGATYRGRALAEPVRNYGTAFSNMHRELHNIYVDGNVVVVQLALQGTHDGPLQLPFGELPATGKQMDAPCCDVFELEDGKIKRFDCYPEGSIIFAQLGVLNNLDAALRH